MMIKIPMHCLVGLLGDAEKQAQLFPKNEHLNLSDIADDLCGPQRSYDFVIRALVEKEMARRIVARLALGQRVVVNFNDLTAEQQTIFVNLARQTGALVIALVDQGSSPGKRKISGTECINSQHGNIVVAQSPLDRVNDLSALRRDWDGITLVGDIHGMKTSLDNVVEWASSRNHLLIFLGDVLDYGPATLEVTDAVYGLVMRGSAALILGNHERKIAKWMDGHGVRLSPGNKVTTTALHGLGDTGKARWLGRFRALYGRAYIHREIENIVLAHAAVHPGYWNKTASSKQIDDWAMFGEIDVKSRPDQFIRSYEWINHIPKGKTVVVGHDCRGEMPVIETGERGGQVIFLDTGSGKGGRLSTADFCFVDNNQLKLQNFNIH